MNDRRRRHGDTSMHERDGDGHVEAIADSVGHQAGELGEAEIQRVVGDDNVGASTAKLDIVMREDRRHVLQIDPVQRVERKHLHVVAEQRPASTDRFGALGDRTLPVLLN